MSNNTNGKCVNGSTIYYNLENIPENIVTKGPFEAVFLGNVISEMSEGCLFVKQQCKSQYPVITSQNWSEWITSIDQENRISLAHTIERSGIPILYNTPRLCDPGISVSKNWSLRNYIETRLYMFKFVYDYGRNFKPTGNAACYPTNIFDFRPFQYKLALPGSVKPLYVTEYITVDQFTKKAAFTPHMAISRFEFKPKFSSTEQIFEDMVKFVIVGEEYGQSRSSISNQSYYLGPANNSGMNVSNFMNGFKKFIQEYDRVKFIGERGLLNNRTVIQTINLTDDVMRVMFYDLIHDGVITKTYKFSTFKKKFINEFKNFNDRGIVSFSEWVGATTAANSWRAYKTILEPSREVKKKTVKRKSVQIRQFPAIFKTLGDLSQFMYAARYGSIVASGDKMGLGAGLYINAKDGRTVKCMMEDAITGFILYTGIQNIDFTTKSGCGNLRNANAGTCLRKNATNAKPATIATQIIQSIPQNQRRGANAIVAAKPRVPGGKSLIKLWLNQDLNKNTATAVLILNTIDKFKNFWDDSDIVKIKTVLNKMQSGPRITNSNKFRASQLMGQLNAATPNIPIKQVSGQKRGRNTPNRQNNQRPTQTPRQANQGNRKTATPRPNNRMNINNQRTNRQNIRMNTNNQRTNNQTPNQQNGIIARLRKSVKA